MNSLKNFLIFALLAVVAYFTYVSMKKEKPASPPPGVDTGNYSFSVELPGTGPSASAPPGFGGSAPATPLAGTTSAAAMTPPAAVAPPFSNPAPGPSTSGSAAAPPWATQAANTPPPSEATSSSPTNNAALSGTTPGYPMSGNPSAVSPAAEATGPPPAAPGPAGADTSASMAPVRPQFVEFMGKARAKLAAGEWKEVHRVLTTWYDEPRLTPEESVQLTDLLDQIAGTAIYSRQAILDEAYLVQPGETLERIADSCKVPWQLLAKINGLRDPQNLPPGTRLKVVRGPFHAVINLESHKLTLMVDRYYAGHFRIGVGSDHPKLEGTYTVQAKMLNPDYYDPKNGGHIAAGDRNNPLGRRLINLGDQIGIHGTNDPNSIGTSQAAGSICLSDRDIDDIYDILSIGSRVTIRR